MQFARHQPSGSLAGYIECLVHFAGFQPDHRVERVVPTGHSFLIFELDGMVRNTFDPVTLEPSGTFSQAWFSGPRCEHLAISAHPGSEMFVVQFAVTGALPFVHRPIDEYAGRVIPAATVFGESVLRLRDALKSAASPENRFGRAEEWLNRMMKAEFGPPEELVRVVELMERQPFNGPAEGYPHSQKHLITLCRKFTGLRPKELQRVFRFNALINRIAADEAVSWAALAHDFGFTDQSHLIREFIRFTGFTPRRFMNRELTAEEMRFIPLDSEG